MRLSDHQADRYWRVETLGGDLMTNWGKVSTSGRYEVKSFADAAECEERAQQLVDAKLKAGFQDFPGFDPMQSFYYDDDEMGLHPLTATRPSASTSARRSITPVSKMQHPSEMMRGVMPYGNSVTSYVVDQRQTLHITQPH